MTKSASLNCWKCSGSLARVVLPIGRRDECPHCAADLHACRLCGFYDPNVSKDCREPVADEVADKERSNFCDYFRPAAGGAEAPGGDEAAAARARLDAAFGKAPEGGAGTLADEARAAQGGSGAAEDSRRKLEKLFGEKG